jgi:acetyl esterase
VILQKAIARLLLRLPPPALVAMSGGEPVVRDGYVLDPQTQFIAHAAARQPRQGAPTPEAARADTDTLVALFGGRREPGVTVSGTVIETPQARLAARIYRPFRQDASLPAILFFHFGGGVVGNTGTCDAFCTILASIVGTAVVSVDYRLAPEHPWPANLEDAHGCFDWVTANAATLGARPGKAAVGGDSMGGHMTAVLCHQRKADGLPQPALQILIYPAVDLTDRGGSMVSCADAFPLTSDLMAWFMSHYLPEGVDAAQPGLSPLLAEDHSGLAPALVVVAGHDPLRDQGLAHAHALEAAGVAVQTRIYGRLAHGFTAMTGGVTAADAACREIATDIGRALRAMA